MAGGRERLQKKHPKVWHEVLRDAVVGVIEKDFQFAGPERQPDAGGYSRSIFSAGVSMSCFAEETVRREINDVSDGDCTEEAKRYLDFLEVLLVPIARSTWRC